MKRLGLLSLCILAFTLLSSAFAQTAPTKDSKEEQEKLQKALEGKALKLLDATLADAQMLKLVENRALFQSVAADLLWTRDEKRARSLFQDAVNSLTMALNSSEPNQGRDNTYWMLAQVRFQTIQTIAGRDPQFALDLLRASRLVVPEGSDWNDGMPDHELMMEQSIAAQAAEKNPKLALKMAQESLKKGISHDLLRLLERLQRKDSEAATQLAVDIVKKVRTEDLTANQEAAFAAAELLRSILQPRNGPDAPIPGQASAKVKPLVLDDETIRDLAETVVSAAMSASRHNPQGLIEVQSLLPDLEKRLPGRTQQLRQRLAEVTQTVDPRMKAWMQYEPLMRNGSTDAILTAAVDAPPQMRNSLYMMAIGKLMQAGDVDRARQITKDNLSGAERDQMLARIDQLAIANAIKRNKIDEAKEIILRLSSSEARAGALAELAAAIILAQGDRKLALELMDEARKLINSPPANQKQIDALMQVAGAYALVEPARAFELINPLIVQASEMIAAAALLDKFGSGQGLFKRGEMLLQHSFSAAQGPYVQHLRKLTSLARADFERTKTAVDGFQRDEIRLMGRLLIAQSVLSDRLGKEKSTNHSFFSVGTSILMSQ
ncbi:MAG: hypothetical protein ABR568_14760 [Pyrinomonadaceae bacterium]